MVALNKGVPCSCGAWEGTQRGANRMLGGDEVGTGLELHQCVEGRVMSFAVSAET